MVFYAICVITRKDSKFIPTINGNINFYIFNYDEPSKESRKLFREGIQKGCQAFVISDDTFLNFLADFHKIHDNCTQAYPNKHVVVYQTDEERKLTEFIAPYKQFSSIDGKNNFMTSNVTLFNHSKNINQCLDLPNILFIEYWKKIETFKLLTTNFAGLNEESSSISVIAELGSDENPREKFLGKDLYPDKILDLRGRDVVLSIFNYMPYVLWKEVVSRIV